MWSRKLTFGAGVIFGFVLLAIPATAQSGSSSPDPESKPRKVKLEPAKALKQFLVDVDPIITPQERAAFDKLQTIEEREQFIDSFWRRRNPDPDTEENEYREQYYERIAYANEHFSSGIPGYKSDRGRIYIRFGKPDEVESHPAGGSYDRESWEGGGSTSTYPFERWFYRNIRGGSSAEIEFVDPTGSGEYRVARNPFEKMVMLNVPGSASSLPGGPSQAELAAAAGGVGNPFSPRSQDSGFEWLERMRMLETPPPVDFNRGTGTNSPIVEENALSTGVQISYFKQSDSLALAAFTIQTDNRDLVFKDSGGIQTARLNIWGRITTLTGRRVGFFEDTVTTTATPAELAEAKDRKSAYQKALSLEPGRYRVDLIVRDVESGAASTSHIGFVVPKFGETLATSSLILASVLQQADEPLSRQFVIGDKKVIPNLSASYQRGVPVGLYMQIYNAGIDQTTLRPSVDVDYVLLKDGKELGKQPEDWRGNGDAGQRLTVARLVDTRGLAPGEYTIEVRVRDHVSGQSLVQSAKFTVVR